MYSNKAWPSYPPSSPTMVSPAMQTPGLSAPMPNMGYPGGMSGGFPGAGFPGMGGYPTSVAGASTAMPGAGVPPQVSSGAPMLPDGTVIPGVSGQEESYIENILRMNLGKVATIYMTFENNREWNAKVFKGVLEAAGRDHIIISDPTMGRRYLLLMVNLDYITFDEPLTYTLPYGMGAASGLTRSQ